MDKNQVRLRINLESREFEIEGDSSYINERFGSDIDEYLNMLKTANKRHPVSSPNVSIIKEETTKGHSSPSRANNISLMPDTFGEYFSKFSKTLSIVDKLLVASYYVQGHNQDKVFTLKEAVDLLLEQGVKLSNPNAFNKANTESKRIFKVTGKNFRVSESGIEYINNLTSTLI